MPEFTYPKKPRATRDMIMSRIAENERIYKEQKAAEEINNRQYRVSLENQEKTIANRMNQQSRYRKFTGFTERIQEQLLEAAIFNLVSGALKKVDASQGTHICENDLTNTTLHSMIFQFIHENNGASSLLANMRMNGHTYFLNETYNAIMKHFHMVVESVDRDDPDSLVVKDEITRSYHDAIETDDAEVMSEVISDRVVGAIEEFINDNARDKEAIVNTLNATKEKIDSEDNETIKESYNRLGKRVVTEIRNRPHGLFNEMVATLSKEVMTNEALHENFMHGGNLDVGKIVDKVTMMYTFLETVNTMRLKKITPKYIREHVLEIN